MITTGHVAPRVTETLLGSVRLNVVIARREKLDAKWNYELCSPFWRLYWQHEAGAELEYDGRWRPLRARRVYLLPAGIRFRTRLGRESQNLWQDYMHFDVGGFPPALLRRLFPSLIELEGKGSISALVAEWGAGVETGEEELAQRWRSLALVHAAMALAVGQATPEGRRACEAWLALPPVVAEALRLIDASSRVPPGNGELAEACGLGVRQFLRRFKAEVGLSPGQYALERRVALAADALARGHEPVDSIAGRLGFADRFHFSKVFKGRVGVPPAAYRRMHGIRVETRE